MFPAGPPQGFSSFEEMMKFRTTQDIPNFFYDLEGVRRDPQGNLFTPKPGQLPTTITRPRPELENVFMGNMNPGSADTFKPLGGMFDGKQFDSVKSAYDYAVKSAADARAGGMLGRVLLPGEMGFEGFSDLFNRLNDPNAQQPIASLSGQQLPQMSDFGGQGGMDRPLSGIPAAGYADGGRITSLEDMDREGFVLGGIAKGLKKAVRGIKKLAKSPIGKAALTFAALKYGGGFSKGLKPKLFGSPALAGSGREFFMGMGGKSAATKGILGKLGLTAGGGSMMPTALGGITLASLAAGAMTPKEDEDKFDLDSYYASGKLNPSLSTRMMGSDFDFYGGQRIASAEGGSTDKEPVAKKTMPLLDMDGKEMDLREEGGFVPIGRMEKADDVPARLSKNEFVFTADAVRNAGDGDVDKGAEVMYNMMKNLEAGGEVSEESQGLEGARKMFQTSQRLEEVL
jgi:hypothetical protein